MVGISKEVTSFTLEWPDAILLKNDARYHSRLYRFKTPWTAATTTDVIYKARVERSAFQPMNRENYILEHASYIEIEKLIPYFGFNEARALVDPIIRQKWDLTETRESIEVAGEHQHSGNWQTFRLSISTDAEHTVIAPGDLEKSWKTENRQHFLYTNQRPLPGGLGITSAVYDQKTITSDGIDITYFYPPSQPYFVDKFLEATATSLAFGQKHFGPYPFKTYKIAAIPSFSNRVGGTAYAGSIFIVEDRVLLQNQQPGELDMPLNLMAHEAAHQWWGRLLNPADAKGSPVLSEGFANYCEMVIAEAQHGREETYRNLERSLERYFTFRAFDRDPEPPLSEVESQAYVAYEKGLHVFYVLRELLGEPLINKAMQQLLEDFPYPRRPVVSDFLERLIALAPANQTSKIHELFHTVTTYDLRILQGRFEQTNKIHQATLQLSLSKRQEGEGEAEETPLNTWLELVLMKGDLPIKTERIFANQRDVEVTVSSEIAFDRVILDPRRLHLEATHLDNAWLHKP